MIPSVSVSVDSTWKAANPKMTVKRAKPAERPEISGHDSGGQIRGNPDHDRLDHQGRAQIQTGDGQTNGKVHGVQRSYRIERVQLAVEEHSFRAEEVGLRIAPRDDPTDREEPAIARLPVLHQRGEVCDDAASEGGRSSQESEPVEPRQRRAVTPLGSAGRRDRTTERASIAATAAYSATGR